MEDASLRISSEPGRYNLDTTQSVNKLPPLPSAGIGPDRIGDAPPASAVDTESQLSNRYDILGKYGVVPLDADKESALLRAARQQKPPPPPPPRSALPAPDAFFALIDDRVAGASCDPTASFYRFDPNPPALNVPILSDMVRGGTASRLDAKDAYFVSCAKK